MKVPRDCALDREHLDDLASGRSRYPFTVASFCLPRSRLGNTRNKGGGMRRGAWLLGVVASLVTAAEPSAQRVNRPSGRSFQVEEATIGDIQRAIEKKQLTATELVYLYLDRVAAYNGTCVNQPDGILGRFSPIRNAGQINALMTLNLRPQARKALGFDDRKARSMTDLVDNDPAMPDALEV